jgi:ATP-dependent Lon protease
MIKRMERVEDTLHLIVQGSDRIQLMAWEQQSRSCGHVCGAAAFVSQGQRNRRSDQAQRSIIDSTGAGLSAAGAARSSHDCAQRDDPVRLAYFLGSILNLGVEKEQQMLEAGTVDDLLHLSHDFLAREVEIIRLRSKIANEAQTEMDKAQRDYVLRQQMKAIRKSWEKTKAANRPKRPSCASAWPKPICRRGSQGS